MNIGIPKEKTEHESRVALVPSHIKPLIKKGFGVYVEKDAGADAGYMDSEYEEKGATIIDDFKTLAEKARVILSVRSANAAENGEDMVGMLGEDHILIGMLEPYERDASFERLLTNKTTAFSMELIPRTTRAQSMDVLSSMANLAGYKSVIIGANHASRLFPMMMTAAGTITPASVFVLGVGVAGLQAIATAKRLGAVTSAYDIRSEVKEQVESLGAKFVEFDLESGEGEGGYAKEMDESFYEQQRQMMFEELSNKDVVITTANIPGKKAPTLITKEMVEAMQKGSVIVDLAAERGGNCELSKAGETVEHNGVKIVGPINLPAALAYNASALYSKNITSFLFNLFKKDEGASSSINWEDDIVNATAITHDGELKSDKAKQFIGGNES